MRSRTRLLIALLVVPAMASAQDTFSIVAVDTETGEVGSAGASCLKVDVSLISDVHPGVGAINTQALYDAGNQSFAYILMNDGHTPKEIIDSLLANDAQGLPAIRQYGVAMLLPGGSGAAGHTGDQCTDYKGHRLGTHYAIQGNILLGPEILDSMQARFLRTEGTLADRLMGALQGANVSGADTRCAQYGTSSLSAFLRVAKPGDPEDDLWLDLRATIPNGSKEPIDSLQTLYDRWKVGAAPEPAGERALRLEINPSLLTSDAVIAYELPTASTITVELFDGLGRRAATLVNGRRDAGRHEVTLERDSLAVGVYYVRLNACRNVLTRRVIVER